MMRKLLARIALAAVVGAATLAAPVAALAQAPDQLRVDVTLKDADMLHATQMLTKLTGVQFLIEPSEQPYPRVSLNLKGVTAEEALGYICRAAGARFRMDEMGVFIISRGTREPEAPVTTAAPVLKPKLVVEKFTLLKGDPETVYYQLLGTIPDPNLALRKLLSNSDTLKAGPKYGQLQPVQFAMLNGPQQGYQAVPTQNYTSPQAGFEAGANIMLPGESAGQGALGGGGFGGPGQGGGPGGGFGGPGQGGGPGGGVGGQGGPGQGGGQGNLQAGQGLVPDGISHIAYDPTDNSLVVRGTEEAIAELQRNISLFDVAPEQVIIKVEFITTSSSVSRSLGFDFLYNRGTVFAGNRPGSFARAGDPIFLNFATGNITMRMRTLLLEGMGRTVQAPIVRTLNNQTAIVQQVVSTNIIVTSLVATNGGQVITAPQLVPITITTGLAVSPRINRDRTITMALSPTVQDFGQSRRAPDGTEVPDILAQTISVVARVRNGETIVLGGLTRKSDTGSRSRFPILADLPIIGQFFRSETREKSNSELLIFVTPTIVDDDETLGGP